MKNNCGCGGDTPKKEFKPVIEPDKPLVFDIPKAKKFASKSTASKEAPMMEVQEEEKEAEAYEKTTIIDDEALKPREAMASGWLWFGGALMVGGIVWKAQQDS